jgi:hypothetical protein
MKAGNEPNIFLSTLPASSGDCKAALAAVGVSTMLFALALPYAAVPLAQIPALVASHQAALAVINLITAVLLFSQFAVLRSRALLLLASGYLLTAPISLVHVLTFPGVFAPTGLLQAGPQTSAWLYIFWHGGFPLLVIGYALSKGDHGGSKVGYPVGKAVLASVIAVGAAVAVIAWFVIAQHDLFPMLMNQGRYKPAYLAAVGVVLCISCSALIVLWFRRPHSVLDVWLMVALCAWLFEIALSAIVNTGHFDLGFYAGRV